MILLLGGVQMTTFYGVKHESDLEGKVFMKLYDEAFEFVKNGKKKIEVRCNDKKRRKLKVGDKIIFSKYSNPKEKIRVEITDLKSFQ